MKINCIVVEDEPLALERTVSYIKKVPALHVAATFDNALDAFSFFTIQHTGNYFFWILTWVKSPAYNCSSPYVLKAM